MTNKDQSTQHDEILEGKVKAAVENGDDIRGEVRKLVMEALVEHQLDPQGVERTISAVLRGAMEAAPPGSRELVDVMQQSVDGLDDAIAKAAVASKLAIEEASSRAGEFSQQDLKRAVDDLKGLEVLFFETLGDLAKAGHGASGEILHNLLSHTERTGTQIGRSVEEALKTLGDATARSERPHLADVETAVRNGTASLVSIASGILAGLADSLAETHRASDKDKPKDG